MTKDEFRLRQILKPEIVSKLISSCIDLSMVCVDRNGGVAIWVAGTNPVLDYKREKGLL